MTTGQEPTHRPKDVIIVANDRPLLYATLRHMSIGEQDIEVRLDRRRRGAMPPALLHERRRTYITTHLQTTGWVLIPGAGKRPAA
jgi:hypothetical protein